ncbi:MAG: cyclic nucleotide-binding domain-containing protein [Thermodesulfobacteriota bacterium]
MDSTIRFIKDALVFKGLDEPSLAEVAGFFRSRAYRSGQPVVYMGDESDSVFLIEEGECKVSIPFDFNMGENILSFLRPGELFGEMGVITGNPRAANITCTADTRLLIMSDKDFWGITEKHPIVLKNIIGILSERLVAQNEGRGARRRAPLNLSKLQRDRIECFYRFIDRQSRSLVEKKMTAQVPVRAPGLQCLAPVRWALRGMARFFVRIATAPYIGEIRGAENLPDNTPAIFVLNFRAYFDLLFFRAALGRVAPKRSLCFGVQVSHLGRWRFFLLRGLLWAMPVAWLAKDYSDPRKGSEDAAFFLQRHGPPGRVVDMALHPFFKRSMRYDTPMTYDHLNIWLDGGRYRCIVPVAITGTDKFWPFEPWTRWFPSLTALLKLKSVTVSIGPPVFPAESGFGESVDGCGGEAGKIRQVLDRANRMIGARLAGLEGQQYLPLSDHGGEALLRVFNDRWFNRLSLMLPAGLSLRKKYRKASVRIRHFMWHAEMLNVLLEHLEGDGYVLPPWAKGMLIAGATYPDTRWPYFSMDHSYNPYTGKGMKLIIRFPDLMSLIRSEVDGLLAAVDRGDGIDGILDRIGRIYHYLSDLAIPAHVHNIPHMFLDLPKIGKCDFEEYLGLDRQLMLLNSHDIGDISAAAMSSFDGFYAALEHIARFTFLSSSFTVEQMRAIARDRMIPDAGDTAALIGKLSQVGVTVQPVEGYDPEERYYVRNLTSSECEEISLKTILFSLKTIAACFVFLIDVVVDGLEGQAGECDRIDGKGEEGSCLARII